MSFSEKTNTFRAKYYHGPADGLDSFVHPNNDGFPDDISCLELYSLVDLSSQLGQHFVANRSPHAIRVAVYTADIDYEQFLEASEFGIDENNKYESITVNYEFSEMLYYYEYLDKYENKEN